MDSNKSYAYTIGEEVYSQKPMKMGQVHQLLELLEGVNFSGATTPVELLTILGPKLKKAIAIILHVPGVPLRNKNIDELADKLAFDMEPEQEMVIIEDFFDCNQISSLLERLSGMVDKVGKSMIKETGLNKSASSSQEGTSPNETT